ncbi:MAG: potassium channel protein [Lentisphaerae bacterium]|nr:potassium channel protein [Lentisphaerota bacterium]MBT4815591.1 potassium channel protein [Lentisphaerota bacterium]MBT5605547.1 potassium channel protein [Lentisphaerota bacterium]MBT7056824.1 potassium channel protein [Lentisphaerota bacterium]MBT7845390.1 potassium channel protein [Lentisphaerota bacterium]
MNERNFDQNRRRLIRAGFMLVVVMTIGTAGFRILCPTINDGQGNAIPLSWLQCVYMTVISITTVGYGESVPVEGRAPLMIFTCLFLLGGISVLTYSFGSLTAFLIEGALTDAFWRRKMNKKRRILNDHFIVCGAGETSMTAIKELTAVKRPFLVLDTDEEQLHELAESQDVCVLAGDATEDGTLEAAGIARARGLLASLPTDRDNLFLVMTARQLNDRLRIVAKVHDLANSQKFLKAGADALASPQVIGGLRLVSELIRPSVVSFLDIMLRDTSRTIRVDEIRIGAHSPHAHSSIKQLSVRAKHKVQILAVKPQGSDQFEYVPDPEEPFGGGSTLIVLGDAVDVERLRRTLETGSDIGKSN